MKKLSFTSLFLAGAFAGVALLPSLASAQSSATTNPVGYRTDTIPAGNTPYAPSFVHEDAYAGQMSALVESAGNTTVTILNGAMTADAFNEGATFPAYYLEITEPGSDQGYVFDVISNTADEVVVAGLLSSGFFLSGDETIAIRKHLTLGDIFDGAKGLSPADSIKLFNDDGATSQFFWDGAQWTADFVNDDSVLPIYPGTGFMATFSSSVTITITGTVKTTDTKVPLYAGVINFISALAPSDTTVDGLNATASLDLSESIKVFSQDGSLAVSAEYFYDGAQMTKDFVNDGGGDGLVGSNSFLVTVGADKYLSIPAAYSN